MSVCIRSLSDILGSEFVVNVEISQLLLCS